MDEERALLPIATSVRDDFLMSVSEYEEFLEKDEVGFYLFFVLGKLELELMACVLFRSFRWRRASTSRRQSVRPFFPPSLPVLAFPSVDFFTRLTGIQYVERVTKGTSSKPMVIVLSTG